MIECKSLYLNMSKLLLSVLLLMGLSSNAQFEKGDHMLMGSYGNMQMSRQVDVYEEINVEYEVQLFRHLSFGYSVGIGRRINDDKYHVHFPGGPILTGALWAVGGALIDDLTFEGIAAAFFASLAITALPERVNVDLYFANDRLKVSPFLKYLAFDYINQDGGAFNRLFYRMGAGVEAKYIDKSNRFVFGGGVSYRNIVRIDHGVNLELKLGVMLNQKSSGVKRSDKTELGYD